MRYKFLIEYEGTRYRGWQGQRDAKTLEGTFYQALCEYFKQEPKEIYAAGRTDAGVHALGQVVHVDLERPPRQGLEPIFYGLNDLLPSDINILAVDVAPKGFHARHSAVARSYTYQIARRRSAFAKKTVWWLKDPLDGDLMQEALTALEGLHDFRAFTDDNPHEKSTKVELLNGNVFDTEELWVIRLVGSHFLWKMVRRLVGMLVEVGRGKLPPQALKDCLDRGDNRFAKAYTAPPSGLFLENVYYDSEEIDFDLNRIIW